MFENHRKSLIQHCERSELRLHFEWTKVNWKCQKWSILASFWKLEACGQTVLPDRSVLIGQKLVEKAKIQKFKCDILSNFQTMWVGEFHEVHTFKDLCSVRWPEFKGKWLFKASYLKQKMALVWIQCELYQQPLLDVVSTPFSSLERTRERDELKLWV